MQFSQIPTHIFWEEHALAHHAEVMGEWGSLALILTGRQGAVKSGALADLLFSLESQGMDAVIFDRVPENPTLSCVRDAAALGLARQADCVIGVGGGSVLDATKAVAVLIANPSLCDDDFFACRWPKGTVLPFGVVGTTAGTGSEITPISIITDQLTGQKRSLCHPDLFPPAAFCDWRYTASMPQNVTISTAIDALCHTVEGYFSVNDPKLVEQTALAAMKTLDKWLNRLCDSPMVYETTKFRQEVYAASLQAGAVIAKNRTGMAHLAGYALTEQAGVPHGIACGTFLPLYLEHVLPVCPQQAAALEEAGLDAIRLSEAVWQLVGGYYEAHPLHLEPARLEQQLERYETASGRQNTPDAPTAEELLEQVCQILELLATA